MVYAFNHDGSLYNQWPASGYTMSSPAIGDIDGDGVKEIAIACCPVVGRGADHLMLIKGNGANRQQTLNVPKNSRRTVRVKDVLGEGNDPSFDFSCRVECTNGGTVVAERPIYFNYNGWTDGHDTVGVSAPAQAWYFAEGYTEN